MAKRGKTVFVCQECGSESPKWVGQCVCGAWNSLVEERADVPAPDDRRRRSTATARPVAVDRITADASPRTATGIGELDRVLGGGLVKGSLTLIAGEPGIGKSTLILQAAASIAERFGPVLYVTGEESEEQVRLRTDRVCTGGLDRLYLMAETNIEAVADAAAEMKPSFLVVDSIQTMYSDALESAPGSVSQVRACAAELMRIGKGYGIPVFLVAHVTKSGDLAGPKIIEHLVDCVLQFNGERSQDLRILRSLKNRFGTTSEIGAFTMGEDGLAEVANLSESFLEGMEDGAEGYMTAAVYEGTRPLLLEVQSLTAPAAGFPRRTAIGVEVSRLAMILAVLERKADVSLLDQDVYVNVVGGLKPEGTSIDLAVALAVFTSFRRIPGDKETLAVGEIGLTGHLRPVRNVEKIVREAARMGFTRILLPRNDAERLAGRYPAVRLVGVGSLREAIEELRQ